MSDGEAPPAGPDVSDAVDESEIKNELNEDWWYLPIKQEEDLDSATFSYPVLNVAPWVCVSAFQLYTDKKPPIGTGVQILPATSFQDHCCK